MTVLILHGIDGYGGIHWQQWLHDSLVYKGVSVVMPTLPNATHPDRDDWLNVLQKSIVNIPTNELIIVAHSLGVVSALDFLEICSSKVKALVSIAGFAENYGSPLNSYFMRSKNINFRKIRRNIEKSYVIYGDNDPYVPQEILQKLANKLEVTQLVMHQGGHLNTDAGFKEFSLLLEIIEKILETK